jgi:hypothetical protein
MEDAGVTATVANSLLKGAAMRVTECDGVYSMTDYMGDSSSKTVHFKFGEEFEIDDPTLGMKGHQIINQSGPGKFTMVYKDSKNGKTSAWEAHLTEDHIVFKITKPLNTQHGSITYRRVADIFGQWKMIALDNAETLMKACGLPDEMIANAVAERPISCHTYMGNGQIKSNSGTAMAPEDNFWKSGEEFSFVIGGFTIHEVMHLTKTGIVGVIKMGEKNLSIKSTVSKNFAVLQEVVDGEPNTKATFILVRV